MDRFSMWKMSMSKEFYDWMYQTDLSELLTGKYTKLYKFNLVQGRREGGGEGGAGEIPVARSAQRGPEISVKCSYCLSSLYVCPKWNTPTCMHTIRWSSSSIVKHTKCEINNFAIVFSAKTVSWTSFTLRFYQLCGDFLQVIRWQFSRWLRLKIASGRIERDSCGPVFTNRHFVPGPVVGSRRPWLSRRNLAECK
jgi:hypothetical protein